MLSLSLSSAVRYKHSLARARASEPLKKIVARGKGDGAFQNFEITTKLFLFFTRLMMEKGRRTPFFFGFRHKPPRTNLPKKEDELQP